MSTQATPATPAVKTAASTAPGTLKRRAEKASVEAPPAFASKVHVDGPAREECIRCGAYAFYQSRGRVDGRSLDDWLAAEAEVDRATLEGVRSLSSLV